MFEVLLITRICLEPQVNGTVYKLSPLVLGRHSVH